MKLNRKFLKKVQREFKPRKSIQHIRECYKNGGILHETEEFTTTIYARSIDLTKMYSFLFDVNVSTTCASTSMATMLDSCSQISSGMEPLYVPLLLSEYKSMPTIKCSDEFKADLTKVVNPKDLTHQLYILMQPPSFMEIIE